MAINFSDKVLVTNPTTYYLGLSVFCLGVALVIVGVITYFTGEIIMPPPGWWAVGVPLSIIGVILVPFGLTKP
jgi:hypothetical protein